MQMPLITKEKPGKSEAKQRLQLLASIKSAFCCSVCVESSCMRPFSAETAAWDCTDLALGKILPHACMIGMNQ